MRVVQSLTLLLLLSISLPVLAQTSAENFEKYTALRERLRRDYVAPGTGPGDGIPASDRRPSIARIRWGDATIRLGWDIGVWATELALLDRQEDFPGLSLERSSTERYLYEALHALERLDNIADASFPAPCTSEPVLNGFFIRDDIPADFHERFEGMDAVASDFLDFETQKEMSQDQVYHLMIGLALVRRYVDPALMVEGRALRGWAMEMAERILRHIVEGETPYTITNPACTRNVARGAATQAYAPGILKMAAYVTDGAFTPTDEGPLAHFWPLGRRIDSGLYGNPDNLHMGMSIAAIGRGWDDTTIGDLRHLAEENGWEVYPLLARALHGDDAGFCEHGDELNRLARAMLDELPLGAEPRNPRPEVAVHGWTTSSRFIRPQDQHYVGAEDSEGFEFNGLDYLLLHNLYYLGTPGEWDGGPGVGVPACPLPGPDAGPTVDAGAADDAGQPDASVPDASTLDGALAGDINPEADSGCACSMERRSEAPGFWLALFGVLLLRRRSRRERNESMSA